YYQVTPVPRDPGADFVNFYWSRLKALFKAWFSAVASFRFFVNFYQSFFTGLLFFIKYDKILVALYKRVAFSRINSHYFFNWLLERAVFFIIYPSLLQTILR
ncbi:TPA: hypothetical protein ACGVRU_002982, partial [Enterococcus faecium]